MTEDTTTRGHSPRAQNSPDNLIHDQGFPHVGTSSFPSPPDHVLLLTNAQAASSVFGDPTHSSHLFTSLPSNNKSVRFQPPIPTTLRPYANPHPHHQYHQDHMFHPRAATVPGFAIIPGATVPSQARMFLHEDETPNSCNECGVQFSHPYHLAHHRCVGGRRGQKCLEESVASAVPTINPSTYSADSVFEEQTEPLDLSIHGRYNKE